MAQKITLTKPTRVPPDVDGIQVNFCKNPVCKNYGVPAVSVELSKKFRIDRYSASGGGSSISVLKCRLCGEYPPLKSNLAISEELARLLADLIPAKSPSCPDVSGCVNARKSGAV